MAIGLQWVLSPNLTIPPPLSYHRYNKRMNFSDIHPSYQKQIISAKQAAKLLGITSRRIRVLANEGRITFSSFDEKKGWQFIKSELKVRPGARGPAFGQNKVVSK